jgi:CBS domain-containing protein
MREDKVMPIGEFAIRDVITAARDTPVIEAARLMRKHHVGDIIITEESGAKRLPVGIVTDRDIVMEVLAQDVDPAKLSAGDIMSGEIVTVKQSEGVWRTIELMRAKGLRRLPVVDDAGALVGIVSADDLIGLLADELSAIAKLITREQKREAASRR